ncbi:tetratricopeptide repeat protein [Rhodanobacter aciditrophus]|uniref:Tetratricopeptide repeat protein n=1 Tax=Rhodanobacter aciditrophus TaxID=1623218 RepID=A0ABW4B2P4_9GAMM
MDKAFYINKASQQKSEYAKLKALVADEFENARQSIRQMLQGLGIEHVDQTSSGKGVIDACRAHRYDVVLCDYRLVGNKNGQQVLEELRELKLLKFNVVFCIVSAETSRDVVMGIMESGPDEYLSKPFTQAVLARRLERQFKQAQALSQMKRLLADEKYDELINECIAHIKSEGRYAPWCKRTLVEAFLATKQYEPLERLCKTELSSREVDWALLGLAKMAVAKQQLDKAIKILERILQLFPQTVAAYDLMAQCLQDKGSTEEAQQVLEDAIRISPRIHKRQKQMAKVSMANGDAMAALKASQQTVRLGVNSIHENPDDYIQFVDIVSESASLADSVDRKRLLSEAGSALSAVAKRFADNDQVKFRKSLAESRLMASQGRNTEAAQALAGAQSLASELEGGMAPELVVEYGKTLYSAGNKDQAEQILSSLVNNGTADKTLRQQASDFLDEPVSGSAKQQAKTLNKEGLALYGNKQYEEAVQQFKTALEHSPRHPGLNLNLVQSCLKLMESQGAKHYLVAECAEAIKRLKHVSEHHKQYKRLVALKEFLIKHYDIKL